MNNCSQKLPQTYTSPRHGFFRLIIADYPVKFNTKLGIHKNIFKYDCPVGTQIYWCPDSGLSFPSIELSRMQEEDGEYLHSNALNKQAQDTIVRTYDDSANRECVRNFFKKFYAYNLVDHPRYWNL